MTTIVSRCQGAMIGLAIGDALGAPVEFLNRGEFPPFAEGGGNYYREGGKFNLTKGEWTDDTSVALCAAQSIVKLKGFDPSELRHQYLRFRDEGNFTTRGEAFDYGGAIRRLTEHGDEEKLSQGNGALMVAVPCAIVYHDLRAAREAYKMATVTHAVVAAEISGVLANWIGILVEGWEKDKLNRYPGMFRMDYEAASRIANGFSKCKGISPVSGHAATTLNAAAEAFRNAKDFEGAVAAAINLGGDTDSVGAVAGALAGAFWGIDGIPRRLVRDLQRANWILDMVTSLVKCRGVI
jgi:ADP-ribosyl-[dinitrogen reductase] hydrolase